MPKEVILRRTRGSSVRRWHDPARRLTTAQIPSSNLSHRRGPSATQTRPCSTFVMTTIPSRRAGLPRLSRVLDGFRSSLLHLPIPPLPHRVGHVHPRHGRLFQSLQRTTDLPDLMGGASTCRAMSCASPTSRASTHLILNSGVIARRELWMPEVVSEM
jgi:hypothetical protein